MPVQKTISPVDGSVCVERELAAASDIESALSRANDAKRSWKATPLPARQKLVEDLVKHVVAQKETLADELTMQMGRPIRYSPGEIVGFESRAQTMLALSDSALADVTPPAQEGFIRFIRREPLGLVLVLAPWNYPWLTAVNAVIPALLAGNVVLLKHSDQTPLVAERFVEAARKAGIPDGVFQFVHTSHSDTAKIIEDNRVNFVAFTGSVTGGHAVRKAAQGRFIGMGFELGGKDAAYVRPDALLDKTVETLVDGAFFNSGQSCCGIERIYVHTDVYDTFVEQAVALTSQYIVGDPRDKATTLGPVVRTRNAEGIVEQISAALGKGAVAQLSKSLTDRTLPYLSPQILTNVDHSMKVMTEETFGPVVGIMKVTSDAQAIELMNDSRYGLTASIWSSDIEASMTLAQDIETGTVFLNRCDYLDPELAWVGVKDSGNGCTLSSVGYEHLTRPKSFHFRKW